MKLDTFEVAKLVGFWKGWRSHVKHSEFPPEAFICAEFGHVAEGRRDHPAGPLVCSRCGERVP